ncbi:MAG: PadR family transcriptional regulator [Candidatus Micrarchaeota archaeon]
MEMLSHKPENVHKQMLKHMLSTFLLWLISKKPMHGYELIKTVEKDGGFKIVTASKVYPILKSLTRKGLIDHEKQAQGRRIKKIYHITDKGKMALKRIRMCLFESELKRQFLKEMTT